MIDIAYIRSNISEAKDRLRDRCAPNLLDEICDIDKKRRLLQQERDQLINHRKSIKTTDSKALQMLKTKLKKIEQQFSEADEMLLEKLSAIPNIPLTDVPKGRTSTENVVKRKWGSKPVFSFKPREYLDLKNTNNLFRLSQAQKVSGARFSYLTGTVAKLELALIQLSFSVCLAKGFMPVFPPTMIRKDIMKAMGYLDQAGEREIFHLKDDDLVLVGTSEQSLGALHAGEILEHSQLPLRYVAFSSCYRREAGSHGKDTKGIFRLHQFDKIEMFSFTTPEQSDKEHELILSIQETICRLLNIPYQVVMLCAGDLGHPSARTYDIECFFPGQNKGKGEYRETHSTSLCTDYQARRLQIKFRDGKGKKSLVHTLNGTGVAIQRMIIAIMENYQQQDGTIQIPEALGKFYFN